MSMILTVYSDDVGVICSDGRQLHVSRDGSKAVRKEDQRKLVVLDPGALVFGSAGNSFIRDVLEESFEEMGVCEDDAVSDFQAYRSRMEALLPWIVSHLDVHRPDLAYGTATLMGWDPGISRIRSVEWSRAGGWDETYLPGQWNVCVFVPDALLDLGCSTITAHLPPVPNLVNPAPPTDELIGQIVAAMRVTHRALFPLHHSVNSNFYWHAVLAPHLRAGFSRLAEIAPLPD